jgi:hypothetical protein
MAATGLGAVVAMGGLALTVDQPAPPESSSVASPVLPGPMTQGDTVTTTIPPSALAIEKAKPKVKANPKSR